MKQTIDIPDELFDIFKKHGIMAFDYFDEYDKDQIAIAIANGTPYNPSGDTISRGKLQEDFKKELNFESATAYIRKLNSLEKTDLVKLMLSLIDNAPAVEVKPQCNQIAWEQGYECGYHQAKEDAIRRIAEQYSAHNELIPKWLSVGDMKGGAE